MMAYPASVNQPAQFNAQIQSVDNSYSVSPEPDGNDNNGAGQRHHRAYQACEACRERKVKCDMGPVDQPHEPPCAKCKREHKQCVFSSSRKKSPGRKVSASASVNGLKRARTGSSIDENSVQRARLTPGFPSPNVSKTSYSTTTSSSGFTNSPASTVSRPTDPSNNRSSVRSIPQILAGPQSNSLTPNLPRQVANLKAGPADEQIHNKMVADLLSTPIASSQDGMQLLFQAAAETQGQSPSAMQSPHSESRRSRKLSGAVSGAYDKINMPIRGADHQAEIDKAIDVWSRMRFVRAGWITAYEAMNYIEYFYTRLAPMTPVVTPDFHAPSRHAILLTEEPVLTLTILTIASRQMALQGVGGNSRSYNVHDKLWDALRRMVERLLWGQEQFGGGFTSAGHGAAIRESTTGQITWKGSLRTLGTIEALLLLTDWHPRALHFPPSGDDENQLVDLSRTQLVVDESAINEDEGSGDVALASSLEPGWRSDRMSWMLLGLAQSLAFELGVFDNDHDPKTMRNDQLADFIRRRRLRRLVLTFVAQNSGRIGIRSMLSPEEDRDKGPNANYKEDRVDRMQNLWLEIASIMYHVNLHIFPSRAHTKTLLDTNRFKDEIDKIAPRIDQWKEQFDLVSNEFDDTMKSVMLMEYEYARLFINSPSFNKVVETWKGQGPHVNNSTLVQVAEENKKYINEVKEAATSLVDAALTGFADPEQLRDAPIRTYLRSFAGMVFTLKLFSLGNHEAAVRKYISLLERIASAMVTQVVDDVHISSQIGQLVKTLLANVMDSFIRVQKPGGTSGELSRDQSPHRHQQRGLPRTSLAQDTRYLSVAAGLSPDPLADIPARPIGEYSSSTFVPPPEFNSNPDINGTLSMGHNMDQSMPDADWFTLPLDHLFTSSGPQYDNGLGGMAMGDTDFIEMLTGSHNNNNNNNNNNNSNNNNNHHHHPHHNHNPNGTAATGTNPHSWFNPGSGLGTMTGF